MNLASLYGRAGRDGELKETSNGKPWAALPMAVELEEGDEAEPVWCSAVAFGAVAETLARVPKGAPLAVSGRLRVRRYTDRNGEEHKEIQVVADSVICAKAAQPGGKRKGKAKAKPDPARQLYGEPAEFDDALPDM